MASKDDRDAKSRIAWHWKYLIGKKLWTLKGGCDILAGFYGDARSPAGRYTLFNNKINTANGRWIYRIAKHDGLPEEIPPLDLLAWAKTRNLTIPKALLDARDELIAEVSNPKKQVSGYSVPGKKVLPQRPQHSEDFTTVDWYGEKHVFTPRQSECIKRLWAAWEKGTHDLSELHILYGHQTTYAEEDCSRKRRTRLRDIFRVTRNKKRKIHAAWGTMIIKGERQGTFRLSDPI